MRTCSVAICLGFANVATSADPVAEPTPAEIVTTLIAELDDEDEEVRRNLAVALARLSPTSVPALTRALADGSADRRAAAALALALIGPPAESALPDLLRAMSDQSPLVRRQVSFAIGRVLSGERREIPDRPRVTQSRAIP